MSDQIIFATEEEIRDAGLNIKDGVVLGKNPYSDQLLVSDGPQHVIVYGPTRCGKSFNTSIPSCLSWPRSLFVFDPKEEIWQYTSGHRKNFLGQKVMKFQPLRDDGTGVHWNPLAEIRFRTTAEEEDIFSVVKGITGDSQTNPFWNNAFIATLRGILPHLFYSFSGPEFPTLVDVLHFIQNKADNVNLLRRLSLFPHISVEDFMEKDSLNPLRAIYGEYIDNFDAINKALEKVSATRGKVASYQCKTVEEVRLAILALGGVDFGIQDFLTSGSESLPENPFRILLTHPLVHASFSHLANLKDSVRSELLGYIRKALSIYENPVVQRNIKESDFCINDLLDANQKVSLYFVMEPKDIALLRPLYRLFISMLMDQAVNSRSGIHVAGKEDPPHLLLMLEEFPEIGYLPNFESFLSVCPSHDVRFCMICQDYSQLQRHYGDYEKIMANCQIQVFFPPHPDSGMTKVFNLPQISFDQTLIFVFAYRPISAKKYKYWENSQEVRSESLVPPKISDTCTKVKTYKDFYHLL